MTFLTGRHLDRRTLLSVAFKFNIIDPNNTYGAYKTKLQTILRRVHHWP